MNCADKIEISAPAAICQMSVFSLRARHLRQLDYAPKEGRREGRRLWMMICPTLRDADEHLGSNTSTLAMQLQVEQGDESHNIRLSQISLLGREP